MLNLLNFRWFLKPRSLGNSLRQPRPPRTTFEKDNWYVVLQIRSKRRKLRQSSSWGRELYNFMPFLVKIKYVSYCKLSLWEILD